MGILGDIWDWLTGEHGTAWGLNEELSEAVRRTEQIKGWYSAATRGKYKPNAKTYEYVGLKSGRLLWLTDSGQDNSTDDAGNSGLTVDTFDTTTCADSAQIKLENTGGSTETIRGAAIRGKPIIRLSGKKVSCMMIL